MSPYALLDRQIEKLVGIRSEMFLLYAMPYYYPGSEQWGYNWKNDDARRTFEQASEVLEYLQKIRETEKEKKG